MESNKLKQKYGFWTASAMIVGIVVGVGIFIKSSRVLEQTGGKLSVALLAWLIGGIIMIFNAYTFSLISSLNENINGLTDYIELTKDKNMSYYVGFYMSTVYLPVITSVVAYFTSGYLMQVLGISSTGLLQVFLTIFLLVFIFFFNVIAPKVAAKFQISSTFIKLIPILLIVILGLVSKSDINLLTTMTSTPLKTNFFAALLITCFAYEGWIIATTISKEVRESDKNLPKALLIGSITVVLIYLLYVLGLSLSISTESVINHGTQAPIIAFKKIFGSNTVPITNIIFFVSCLGGLNGLVMGSSRSFYQIADKNYTNKFSTFGKLNKHFNTSVPSALVSLVITSFYVFLAYLAFNKGFIAGNYDSITIALLYIPYIYIYLYVIRKMKTLNLFKRYIAPILAFIGGLFFVFSAFYEIINGIINNETLFQKIPLTLVLTIASMLIAKSIKK